LEETRREKDLPDAEKIIVINKFLYR